MSANTIEKFRQLGDRTAFVPNHTGPTVLPNTTFFTTLLRHAFTDLTAIKDLNAGSSKTYAELLSDALALREVLSASLPHETILKIENGEEVFVGLLAPGGYEYAVGFLAILALGVAVVPMTTAVPVEEAAYFVTKARQVAIVCAESASKLAGSISEYVHNENKTKAPIPVIPVQKHVPQISIPARHFIITSGRHLDENATAMVIFTSGTTGRPKASTLRRGFISVETVSFAQQMGVKPGDTIQHILPVHHAAGAMTNFLPFIAAGACVEFRSGSFDPKWLWERWRQGGITYFSGVPTIYMRMMRYFDQHLSNLPNSASYKKGAADIRVFMCGTSALPQPVSDFWSNIRNGRPICIRYGATETGVIFRVLPDDRQVPEGSCGEMAPGVDVRLSEGDEGEILIKSPFMFSKYLSDPDATAAAHDEQGYYKTGDIGRRQGKYFWIVGRASQDIIKSGGYKISALDVEREALSLPYINEVMVVGVEDEEYGQRVAAAVTLREDQSRYSATNAGPGAVLTINQLRDDMRRRLASYKLPTLLRVMEGELPKTASGKVLKKVLGPQLFPSPGWNKDTNVQSWRRDREQAKL